MVNRLKSRIESAVVHRIGRKSEEEGIKYSKSLLDVHSPELQKTLLDYFLNAFKEPIYYSFTFHGGDFVLNPMYNYIGNIFDNPDSLHKESIRIANLLYDKSDNPLIKPGELCVAHISELLIEDEMMQAVAIFKSEDKDEFLEVSDQNGNIDLEIHKGINIKKLDKACLVLYNNRDSGFKILNIDHSNRHKEARYWKDDFLYIAPSVDNFHNTSHVIKLTSEFVKKRLPEELNIDAKTQTMMMKRSEAYFKEEVDFDLNTYKERVFKDLGTVEAFDTFHSEKYDNSNLKKDFKISEFAVKKQSRVFRSVIKLDKNFHIYVHGDHSKIVKGELENGQKYYMLYYDEERR